MKKLLGSAALLCLTPLTYAVPLIDLEVGAGVWGSSYSGDIGKTNTDVESLGLDDDNSNVIYATLEFPLPILPNIRIKNTDISTQGSGTLNSNFTLGDRTFDGSAPVNTTLDLSHTDVTLYYGLPEFYLDVDFGLTLRIFDGEASVNGEFANNPLSESIDIDAIIPMAFADVRLNLPFTGFYAGVEGNILSIGDNSLTDITGKIGYETDIIPLIADLEFELGYRSMDLTLEDEDLDTDITIDGPYLGVTLAF